MSFENPSRSTNEAPKRELQGPLIRELMKGPVHGSGMTAYAPEERADVEALFSIAGTSVEDDTVEYLQGETVMDVRDYLAEPVNSLKRRELKSKIITVIKAAMNESLEAK
jgi:hypothetical protein